VLRKPGEASNGSTEASWLGTPAHKLRWAI